LPPVATASSNVRFKPESGCCAFQIGRFIPNVNLGWLGVGNVVPISIIAARAPGPQVFVTDGFSVQRGGARKTARLCWRWKAPPRRVNFLPGYY
jgi:hypothetical protein